MNYIRILEKIIKSRVKSVTVDNYERLYRFANVSLIHSKITDEYIPIQSLRDNLKSLAKIELVDEKITDNILFEYGLKYLYTWKVEGDYFVRKL